MTKNSPNTFRSCHECIDRNVYSVGDAVPKHADEGDEQEKNESWREEQAMKRKTRGRLKWGEQDKREGENKRKA